MLRMRLRLPLQNPNLSKVLVPARLAAGAEIELAQGSHEVLVGGRSVPSEPLQGVCLCHFPIRGVAQYASKIAMGYLQYCATPHWDRAQGFHYIEPFRILKEGLEQLARSMEASSRRYSLEKGVAFTSEPEDAPLRYDGGPLTLTATREDPMASVLQYAETVAAQRAVLLERAAALHAAFIGALPRKSVAAPSRAEDGGPDLPFDLKGLQLELRAITERRDRFLEDKVLMERRLADVEAELTGLQEALYGQEVELSSRTFRIARRVRNTLKEVGLTAVAQRLLRAP